VTRSLAIVLVLANLGCPEKTERPKPPKGGVSTPQLAAAYMLEKCHKLARLEATQLASFKDRAASIMKSAGDAQRDLPRAEDDLASANSAVTRLEGHADSCRKNCEVIKTPTPQCLSYCLPRDHEDRLSEAKRAVASAMQRIDGFKKFLADFPTQKRSVERAIEALIADVQGCFDIAQWDSRFPDLRIVATVSQLLSGSQGPVSFPLSGLDQGLVSESYLRVNNLRTAVDSCTAPRTLAGSTSFEKSSFGVCTIRVNLDLLQTQPTPVYCAARIGQREAALSLFKTRLQSQTVYAWSYAIDGFEIDRDYISERYELGDQLLGSLAREGSPLVRQQIRNAATSAVGSLWTIATKGLQRQRWPENCLPWRYK
jgi:hypothetical protein